MIAQLTPRTFAHIVFKRKRLFLGTLLTVVCATTLYVTLATPGYESDASILVKIGDQEMATPDMLSNQEAKSSQTSATMGQQIVNSERELLLSQDVLRASLQQLGPEYIYPGIVIAAQKENVPVLDLAIKKLLKKDLDVKVNENSNVLQLKLTNRDPAVAQKALQVIIDKFFDKQATVMRDPRLNFLEETREALRKKAAIAQQAVLDFKQRTGITDLEQERNLLLQQRDLTQQSLNESLAGLKSGQERLAVLQRTLSDTPKEVALSDENDRAENQIDQARTRLSNAQARYEEAKLNFAEGNPELLDAQMQLENARRDFNEVNNLSNSRVRTGLNQAYQQIDLNLTNTRSDINGLSASAKERSRQLTDINNRLAFLDANEPALLDLQHQQDVAVQDFKSYLARTETAKIVKDLNQAGINSMSRLQEPTLPYKPASPKTALLMIVSVLVGLSAGLGLCLVAETLDATISLPEQVEGLLGLPVLLTLEFESGATRGTNSMRKRRQVQR